jgi:hypothetical protein
MNRENGNQIELKIRVEIDSGPWEGRSATCDQSCVRLEEVGGQNLTPHRAIWTLATISAVIGAYAALYFFAGSAAPDDKTIATLPHSLWYAIGMSSNGYLSGLPNGLQLVTLVSNFGTFMLYGAQSYRPAAIAIVLMNLEILLMLATTSPATTRVDSVAAAASTTSIRNWIRSDQPTMAGRPKRSLYFSGVPR